MELNVNVNVKLGLDSELVKIVKGAMLPSMLDLALAASRLNEAAAEGEEKPADEAKPAAPLRRVVRKKKVTENTGESQGGNTADENANQAAQIDGGDGDSAEVSGTVVSAAETAGETSDLPFDDGTDAAEEKPLPFVAIWNAEDARKIRKKRMEEIEASVPAEVKDAVHKQMVKITKLYLNSAAYEHKRDEMGTALNADGLPVKKLDELSSNETLRFMYLCEAMYYDAAEMKVYPFDGLDTVLAKCSNWEEVERDFVKTCNKK